MRKSLNCCYHLSCAIFNLPVISFRLNPGPLPYILPGRALQKHPGMLAPVYSKQLKYIGRKSKTKQNVECAIIFNIAMSFTILFYFFKSWFLKYHSFINLHYIHWEMLNSGPLFINMYYPRYIRVNFCKSNFSLLQTYFHSQWLCCEEDNTKYITDSFHQSRLSRLPASNLIIHNFQFNLISRRNFSLFRL